MLMILSMEFSDKQWKSEFLLTQLWFEWCVGTSCIGQWIAFFSQENRLFKDKAF